MVVLSKASVPFSCYEVGHTWVPFCTSAASGIGISCFEEGFKIYSSVYLMSALLTGKLPDIEQLRRLFRSILQSSLFLSCNGFCFISAFCICRKIFGRFGLFSSASFPSFFANLIAICVERPSRRPALAVYVSNVASETIYKQLVARGYFKPIPNGDIILFSLTLACLFRWFQSARDKSNFLYKLLRTLVGEEERMERSKNSHGGLPIPPKSGFWNSKHPLCVHEKGCLKHSFQLLARKLLYSWGLHVCVSVVFSIPRLLRKPSSLWMLLKDRKHFRFGAFIASMVSIHKTVHCALRWINGKNSKNHSIIAGLLSGLSVGFYRNSSLTLYLAWKTLEILYYEGVSSGYLRKIPGFAIILYSLSTSILFHAAVLEPHNLKPAYWGFLNKITDNKISELNRKTLDMIGLESSKMLPKFYPRYHDGYLSEEFKSWLKNVN